MIFKKKKTPELVQQVLMNKWLKWGAALAGTTLASLNSPPTTFLPLGVGLKALIGIVLAVLLMVLMSVGNKKTSWFTAPRTIGLLSLSVFLFLFNTIFIQYYSVMSDGTPSLKGLEYTAKAAVKRDALIHQNGSCSDDRLLQAFENIDDVWTKNSILEVEAAFLALYILSAISIGLTVIGAFDFLQSKIASRRKMPAKKRPQRRSSPRPLKLKLARGPSPSIARSPARARAVTPSRARSGTSIRARAGTSTRAKAGTSTRAKAGASTRAKAGTSTRAKAGTATRAKAGTSTRAKAGTSTRAKAGTATRAKAGTATRVKIGTTTRARARTTTRAKAGTTTRARARTATRAKAGTTTRARARTATRAKAGTTTRARARTATRTHTVTATRVRAGTATRARSRMRIGTQTRKPKTR
jgi:DNA-binding protein HU-beta